MESEPLVSVIIPVYNHERFIEKCLDSLLSQDYLNWEAIIVNDGSTDNSLSIIEKYAQKDSRFIVINQKNVGIFNLHKIYNNALKISKGEFIAVLEGDDFWPKDKLSRQIKSFENDEAIGLSWGDGVYVDVNGHEILRIENQDKIWGKDVVTNSPVGKATWYLLFASNFFNMPTCSVMYRKKALIEIGGFWQPIDLKWLDRPTWILLSLKYKFAYCNFNTGFWRKHNQQVTSKNKDINSTIYYIEKSLKSLKNINNACKKLFDLYYIEIQTQIYLTNIYRHLYKQKDKINILSIFKNLLLLLFLSLKHPIRVIRHILSLYHIRKKYHIKKKKKGKCIYII